MKYNTHNPIQLLQQLQTERKEAVVVTIFSLKRGAVQIGTALFFRKDSPVLHHNTDLWNGTAPINASNHGIWVAGGAWLTQHFWEHYLFNKNEKFLRNEAYPIMKKSAEFFEDFLVKDPKTGWLISTPSNSPENGGLVAGPTMDHQIIRTLFNNCIEASKILGVDESFRKSLQEKVKMIAPNQIGKYLTPSNSFNKTIG